MSQEADRVNRMRGVRGLGCIGKVQIWSQNICNPLFYEKILMAISVMRPILSKFRNWHQCLQIALQIFTMISF